MNTKSLVAEIDAEISRLQNARELLIGLDYIPTSGKRGRPRGSGAKAASTTRIRKKMSPEARAKIAAAQKKRWAAAKKTTKAKSAA